MSQSLNHLLWIEELLPGSAVPRRMHGGVGYYLDEKLSLILIETGDEGEEYKGVSYPFDIWNGCIFPIEKIKQGMVFIKFPFLENHPASAQWLYLPAESENFEEHTKMVIHELIKRNPLFGLPIKTKSRKSDHNEDVKTSRPSIFSENSGRKKIAVKKEAKPTAKDSKKKKSAPKKIKADKKSENTFILSLLKRK